MLNKINSILFYFSFLSFVVNIVVYFMGFIEIIDAINYALIIFGFIGLTLGLMLTKKSPLPLKLAIVGLIGAGSLIWIISIFKIIDFAIFWRYALLLIFSGIIWAIWNKVFVRGTGVMKVIFALSGLMLILCTLLTCFSFFDNSDVLFYSLVAFTASTVIILLVHTLRSRKKVNP
ncbi:MAG: hypothetical protein ACO1O6_01005 [Bacteroidota bacterium]